MTRILCLSDLHGELPELDLDGIDLVLFAGDFSTRQRDDIYTQVNDYLEYFSPWAQSIIDKTEFYWICGNHEVFVEKLPLTYYINNVWRYCINDRLVTTFNDLSIYGFPWTPRFHNWGFNAGDAPEDMGKKCDKIPDEVDILLSHGPPYGILDIVSGRIRLDRNGHPYEIPPLNAGSKELLKVIDRVKPKLVVFGHLHSNFGILEREGVKFVACPLLDENYEQVRKPIIVEI